MYKNIIITTLLFFASTSFALASTIFSDNIGIHDSSPTHSVTFGYASTTPLMAFYNTIDHSTNFSRFIMGYSTSTGAMELFGENGGSGASSIIRLGASNGYLEINTGGGPNKFYFNRVIPSTGNPIMGATAKMSGSSGNQVFSSLTPDMGQSGTAGYTNLLLNAKESSLGSGASYILQGKVTNSSDVTSNKFNFDTAGNLNLVSVGAGLSIAEGSNAKMGVATLENGSTTVSTVAIATSSRVFLTNQDGVGTVGTPYVSSRSSGTGFIISSTEEDDDSQIGWLIINPM